MTVDVQEIGPSSWALAFSTRVRCELAYAYVVDLSRHHEWEENLVAVASAGGSVGQQGARYQKTYGPVPKGLSRLFSKPRRVDCEIDLAEAPYRLHWRQRYIQGASDGYNFQRFELTLTPQEWGCRFSLLRKPSSGDVGTIQAITAMQQWMGDRLDQMPPEQREQARRMLGGDGTGGPNMVSMSQGELAGRALEGVAARGPGQASLERLRTILDSWA